jgi:hypothetical protein
MRLSMKLTLEVGCNKLLNFAIVPVNEKVDSASRPSGHMWMCTFGGRNELVQPVGKVHPRIVLRLCVIGQKIW